MINSKRQFLKQSFAVATTVGGAGSLSSALAGRAISKVVEPGTPDRGWTASPSIIAKFEERAKRRDYKVIYHEEQIPTYSLPDPLLMNNGSKLADAEVWRKNHRPEILELFREHVFGRAPIGRPDGMTFATGTVDPQVLQGAATVKNIVVNFTGESSGLRMDMRVYTPNKATNPVPCFLYLGRPMPADSPLPSRLVEALQEIISRGYALAIIDRSALDGDEHDGFGNGVHGEFDPPGERTGEAWGTIAAWAWGLSRALDYLETDKDVDAKRVAAMGVSLGGKTALWAGAQDERFAMSISVCSGCTGAALSRRRFGEPVGAINARFPNWFCENYHKYNWQEDELPIDQHMLLSLIAPRLLYVSSADEDLWADPRGEFLGAKHANPVYELLGDPGLEADNMPALESPVHAGRIGYHIRRGGHGLEHYDWLRYLDFADRHWR